MTIAIASFHFKGDMMAVSQQMFDELRKPFHPSQVTWKPGAVKGERAMAMPYADLRAYMNRLDEVCGLDWSVAYEPWGDDRIICKLTVANVTRSSTGEMDAQDEKGGMGGTVAEAQAFKRACAMFGLGRYLYNLPTGWVDYDPAAKKFTEGAKAKLLGILTKHYREATQNSSKSAGGEQETPGDLAQARAAFNALGEELYQDQWPMVSKRNTSRITDGATKDADALTVAQLQKMIAGMEKVKSSKAEAQPA